MGSHHHKFKICKFIPVSPIAYSILSVNIDICRSVEANLMDTPEQASELSLHGSPRCIFLHDLDCGGTAVLELSCSVSVLSTISIVRLSSAPSSPAICHIR